MLSTMRVKVRIVTCRVHRRFEFDRGRTPNGGLIEQTAVRVNITGLPVTMMMMTVVVGSAIASVVTAWRNGRCVGLLLVAYAMVTMIG